MEGFVLVYAALVTISWMGLDILWTQASSWGPASYRPPYWTVIAGALAWPLTVGYVIWRVISGKRR